MNDKKMLSDWKRLWDVGNALMENSVSLIGLSFLVTSVCIGLGGNPYQSLFGPVGFS